jgi:outer membrane lipoprotein-sorting protein
VKPVFTDRFNDFADGFRESAAVSLVLSGFYEGRGDAAVLAKLCPNGGARPFYSARAMSLARIPDKPPRRDSLHLGKFPAMRSFLAGLAGVFVAFSMGTATWPAAFAQDAPMDLHAPAARSGKAPKAKATLTPLSNEEILARANAYLNSARVMTAKFVQVSASGHRTEGELSLERPGKMLFHYDPPAHLEIIADGSTVAVRDTELSTEDLYLIGQTPLKFLLKDHIDLATDTNLLSISADDRSVAIELEDNATFGGSSHLTLIFDPKTFALTQWIVIDPQRSQTIVSLFNVDLTSRPDESLFVIPPKPITPGMKH